jgi:hypothetical protein
MMLYTFCKKDNNVIIVGAESSVPPELDAAVLTYSQAGWVPAEEAEYFAQEIGVLNARIAELEAKVNPPVAPATGAAASVPAAT